MSTKCQRISRSGSLRKAALRHETPPSPRQAQEAQMWVGHRSCRSHCPTGYIAHRECIVELLEGTVTHRTRDPVRKMVPRTRKRAHVDRCGAVRGQQIGLCRSHISVIASHDRKQRNIHQKRLPLPRHLPWKNLGGCCLWNGR